MTDATTTMAGPAITNQTWPNFHHGAGEIGFELDIFTTFTKQPPGGPQSTPNKMAWNRSFGAATGQ